jgi:hypothetical protein
MDSMKQFIKVVIFSFIMLVNIEAMASDNIQAKTIWKIFQIDNQVDKRAVLISDDYEIWLLHGLQPNNLTWGEWIYRQEVPQPDARYFFDINKWEEGKEISIVYYPWNECEWQDTYRNDASLLQYCEYVIENSVCNSRVFAKRLQMGEWKSLYIDLREEVADLADRGFYGHAANLLNAERLFVNFQEELIKEKKNKVEGNSFDGRYTAFYDLCPPDFFF